MTWMVYTCYHPSKYQTVRIKYSQLYLILLLQEFYGVCFVEKGVLKGQAIEFHLLQLKTDMVQFSWKRETTNLTEIQSRNFNSIKEALLEVSFFLNSDSNIQLQHIVQSERVFDELCGEFDSYLL